jgi:hypothetical protein
MTVRIANIDAPSMQDYLDTYVDDLCKQVGTCGQWKRNAWSTLMSLLTELEEDVAEGAPCAVGQYGRVVGFSVMYLLLHPAMAKKHFAFFEQRVECSRTLLKHKMEMHLTWEDLIRKATSQERYYVDAEIQLIADECRTLETSLAQLRKHVLKNA